VYFRTDMNRQLRYFLLAFVFVVIGCANTGSPPGGPEDNSSPEIIATDPPQGATNVSVDTKITIEFDEPIQTKTLTGAFALSPTPPGAVRARWRGERLTLSFDPPLRDDRTYVLSLGTGLQDLRNNPLTDAYHLAFSTGDSLDTARLHGFLKVKGENAGWTIMGYRLLEDSTATDPDPAYDLPDATTQANKDGSWDLLNLREGMWRVFAFKDVDLDRLWTPWSEKLAVPPYDVEARQDSTYTPRLLTLTPVDRPTLAQPSRVSALVRDKLEVRFDRKPSALDGQFRLSIVPEWVLTELEVSSDAADTSIGIKEVGYKASDSTIVELLLQRPPAGEVVWLDIAGGFGTSDMVDTGFVADLRNSADVDTFHPGLVGFNPPANSRLHQGRNFIELTFSKKMDTLQRGAISLVYLDAQDTLVPVIGQPDSWRASFPVNTDLAGRLNVELYGELIQDVNGQKMVDSLKVIQFMVLTKDSLGTLTGSVGLSEEKGDVFLKLISISGNDLALEEKVNAPGTFRFGNVPNGMWWIQGWSDRDGDGLWNSGVAVPFNPSEPVHILTDTLDVRARWETAGVSFIFP